MAPRSAVLTSLGAVSAVLLLSTFITGNLHYQQAARHQDSPPVLYKAQSSSSSSSPAALRGSHADARDGDEQEQPHHLFASATDRTPRTRRYLAFIPLLGFKVDDRGSQESERLTLKAWDAMAAHVSSLDDEEYDVELQVVGMVEDAGHCDPLLFGPSAHLLSSGAVSCVTLDPSCRHAEFQGILTMDCILNTALELGEAWGADVYILANGDVVFTPTLTEAIAFALDTFGDGALSFPSAAAVPGAAAAVAAGTLVVEEEQKAVVLEEDVASPTSPSSPSSSSPPTPSSTSSSSSPSSPPSSRRGFAMVGRRMDLNVTLPDSPDDPPLTEESLLHSDVEVRLHPATGIDYFAFTPNIFPRAFPPYLIGRWRWDNALLLHFLLSGAASIDASDVVHALHIGMGSYHSAEHAARAGGQYNDALAGNTTGSGHSLGRIDHTTYVLKQRKLTEEEAEEAKRQEQRLSLVVERRSQPLGEGQLAALRVTGGSSLVGNSNSDSEEEEEEEQQQQQQDKADKTVLLLPVQVGEKELALEWICWARRMHVDNYLLLVADKSEARALEAMLLTTTTSSSSSSSGGDGGGEGEGGVQGGEVVWINPGQLSVHGWAGSKPYFQQKRSGKASPAVLALGTGQLIRRLLRLDLAMVLVPSLASFLPLAVSSSSSSSASAAASPPFSWWVLEEEGREGGEEAVEESMMQELMMSLVRPSGETGACDVTLWEEGKEESAVKDKVELTEEEGEGEEKEAVATDEDENKKEKQPPFTYAHLEPTSEVLKGWDVVMACLKEDVRHSSSREGWCLAGVSSSFCRQRVPVPAVPAPAGVAGAAATAVPAHRWWDAAASQCQIDKMSGSRSSSSGSSSSSSSVTAMARDLGA